MAPFLNSPPPLSLLPVERGLGRKKREPGATQHRRVFQQLSMWRRCVQTAGGPSPVRSDVVSTTESNLNSWALSFDHFWPLRLPPTSTCCWDRTGLSLDVQEAGDIEDRYRSHLDRGWLSQVEFASCPQDGNSLDSYASLPGCLGTGSSKLSCQKQDGE